LWSSPKCESQRGESLRPDFVWIDERDISLRIAAVHREVSLVLRDAYLATS